MRTATQQHQWRQQASSWLTYAALGVGMILMPQVATHGSQATTPTAFSVVHNFTGAAGASSFQGVIADPSGNLYGAAYSAGTLGFGLIFKLNPAGRETILHEFTGGSDGARPFGALLRDDDGNLYGTTVFGGHSNASCPDGCGVVFKLDLAGQETVLHTFTGGSDGSAPQAGLIRDTDGNFFGTASSGGDGSSGVVFKLDASEQFTVLHAFAGGTDGAFPQASLVEDVDGNLYGTTTNGGSTDRRCALTSGCGVVFKVTPSADETVIHTFTEGPGGAFPGAALILDSDGNLLGTTFGGGNTSAYCNSGSGCGVVFKLEPTGTETVLYTFNGGVDGWGPAAGLLLGADNNLYGTTEFGGSLFGGVVFRLSPDGRQTVLHAFSRPDGFFPEASLVENKGHLFGTTTQGGSHGYGTVFELER